MDDLRELRLHSELLLLSTPYWLLSWWIKLLCLGTCSSPPC